MISPSCVNSYNLFWAGSVTYKCPLLGLKARPFSVPRSSFFNESLWTWLDLIASVASKPSEGCGDIDTISESPASRTNKRPFSESNVIPCGSFMPNAWTGNRSRDEEGLGKPLLSALICTSSDLPRSNTNRLSDFLSKAVFNGSDCTSEWVIVPALSSPIVTRAIFALSLKMKKVFAAGENANPFGSWIPYSLV